MFGRVSRRGVVLVVTVAAMLAVVLAAEPALASGGGSFSSVTPDNVAWMGADFADANNAAIAGRAAGTLGVQDDLAITAAREAGIVGKAPTLAGQVTKVGKWIWALSTLRDVLSAAYHFSRGDVAALPDGDGTAPVQPPPATGGGNGCVTSGAHISAVNSGSGYCSVTVTGFAVVKWWLRGSWNGTAYLGGAVNGLVGSAGRPASGQPMFVYNYEECVSGTAGAPTGCSVVGTLWAAPQGSYFPAEIPGAGANPNPSRHIAVTATCVNPVTEASSYVEGDTASFNMYLAGVDLAQETGTAPASPVVSCPPGTYVDGSKTEVVTDGSVTRVAVDVPYVASIQTRAMVRANPECAPVGAVVCELKLWRVDPAPDLDCHASAAGVNNACIDWWDDPAKATKYQCRWAGAGIELWRCDGYRQVFRVGGPVGVTPPADPGPNPEVVDPSADKTPGLNDDGCMPSGWSLLNPFALLKGLACAVKWAAIPPPGMMSGPFNEFSDKWSSRPPGSVVASATDVVGGLGSGWSGTCTGSGSADFSPATAPGSLVLPCAPAGAGPGSVPYTVMQIALIVFALFGVWHMVSAAIGGAATGGGD